MIKIFPTIVFVLIFSLALCGKDEKYSFMVNGGRVADVGEKWTYKKTHETSFSIPEIGFVKYSGQYIERMEYMGIEGEFWKFKATLTNIESDNYVNGIEILDQYREAMEDTPCYLYVKSSGNNDEPHHIEPLKEEHAFLQEAFEAAHMNIHPKHFRTSFGGEIDVSEGDKWSYGHDSIKFYVNMGSPPSLVSSKGSYELNKVKKKRGRKIAFIDMEENVTLDLRVAVHFLGNRRLIAGHATGTTGAKYRWDIDSGEIINVRVVINLVGDFEMDGEAFHMKIFQRLTTKKIN